MREDVVNSLNWLIDGDISYANKEDRRAHILNEWDALEAIIEEQKKEIAEKDAMLARFADQVKANQESIANAMQHIIARKQENEELVLENIRLNELLNQDHLQPEEQDDDDEQEIPTSEKQVQQALRNRGWHVELAAAKGVDFSMTPDFATNFHKMATQSRLPIWKVYRPDGVMVFVFAEDRQEWDDLINETRVTQDHVRFCIEKLGYKVRCE